MLNDSKLFIFTQVVEITNGQETVYLEQIMQVKDSKRDDVIKKVQSRNGKNIDVLLNQLCEK